MFTDMKGSSALMEAHPVHQVLGILNAYSAIVVRIVQSHGGEVHKFLGDGHMALFRSPSDAIRAGCEIQRAVTELNARRQAQGLWCFETRLAIDTGTVILASVGTPDRYDYTLFGRAVNRAAHLSESATPGTVWISQGTYNDLEHELACHTVPVSQTQEPHAAVYEIACV